MPVERIDAPREIDNMVDHAIAGLGNLSGAIGLGIAEGDLSAFEAIPLHGFRKQRGEGAFDRSDFPLLGWRSLVVDAAEKVVAVDIDIDGDDYSLQRVFSGTTLERLVERSTRLEALAAGQAYTLRLVEVPSIKLAAIWLERGENSIFLPYSDGPSMALDCEEFYELTAARMPAPPTTAASAKTEHEIALDDEYDAANEDFDRLDLLAEDGDFEPDKSKKADKKQEGSA